MVWNGRKVLHWQLLATKPETILEERIDFILGGVRIAVRNFKPDLVCLEGAKHGGRSNDNRPHMVTGVLRWKLWKWGQPFATLQPNEVKAYATENGNASKEMMVEAALPILPEISTLAKAVGHNVADALHLARAAYDLYDRLTEPADLED